MASPGGRTAAALRDRVRSRPLALGVVAAAASLLVGHLLFAHLSTNHDEGVYLQQAAMLLEGRLFLHPPVRGAFRPWFFVADGGRLYAKYSPVPAAVFAAGKLLGSYRFGVAAAAATVVAGTHGVAREVFADRPDRDRLALYAAGFVLASPLFLVHAGLFLPYLPTAALNVGFAYGYLRADRTGRLRWAGLAGLAIGLAFFARPYTAVLFSLPFAGHALWSLRDVDFDQLVRHAVVAALGLAGVVVALGYNAAVTGDPLTFPYQAFAPRDGLGFGRRAILGYDLVYTPRLALRANAEVTAQLFGRWVAFGAVGSALALVGIATVAARRRDRGLRDRALARRAALAGLFPAVVLGNVYFWGNRNVLGRLSDPADGLVHYYGPFYHLDLLVPTAVFAALGASVARRRLRRTLRDRAPAGRRRATVVAGFVVVATAVTAAGAGVVALPVAESAQTTAELDRAYEPFDGRDLDDSLVFLPTPYGDWLNHPLQRLRNDPGFDGETVYALDGERPLSVVDGYPNRTYYRYAFRGPWTPLAGGPVEARLQPVRQVRGERVVVDATVGVPEGARSVTLTLSTGRGQTSYAVAEPGNRTSFRVLVANGTARLVRADGRPVENASVPASESGTVVTTAFVDYPVGGFSYRVGLPVQRAGDGTRALTPRLEVCRTAQLCGSQASYVPGSHRPGVSMNVSLAAEDKT